MGLRAIHLGNCMLVLLVLGTLEGVSTLLSAGMMGDNEGASFNALHFARELVRRGEFDALSFDAGSCC